MLFKNKKALFIHIPRTSGTYIEKQICKKHNIEMIWPKYNKDSIYGLIRYNDYTYFALQHLTFTEMINYNFVENYEDYYIFTIIRNPFDRFLSLFYYWKQTNIDTFLEILEHMNLNNYDHTGILTTRKDFDFKNMIHNMFDCKYHFISQYKYIENIDMNKLHLIKMNNTSLLNDIFDANINFFKQDRDKSKFPDLTKEQIKRIITIYKKDFEIFEYSESYDINMEW
jgi:hypothetical protein